MQENKFIKPLIFSLVLMGILILYLIYSVSSNFYSNAEYNFSFKYDSNSAVVFEGIKQMPFVHYAVQVDTTSLDDVLPKFKYFFFDVYDASSGVLEQECDVDKFWTLDFPNMEHSTIKVDGKDANYFALDVSGTRKETICFVNKEKVYAIHTQRPLEGEENEYIKSLIDKILDSVKLHD